MAIGGRGDRGGDDPSFEGQDYPLYLASAAAPFMAFRFFLPLVMLVIPIGGFYQPTILPILVILVKNLGSLPTNEINGLWQCW